MSNAGAPDQSPNTAAWNAVRALYATPGVSPASIVDAIFAASAADYQRGLADPVLRIYLSVLLAWDQGTDLVRVSGEVRYRASREVHHHAAVSFYAGLADIAMHRVILHGGLVPDRSVRARLFLAELVGAAIDYLASRDLSGFVGGPAIPNVTALIALKDAIVAEAQRRAMLVPMSYDAQRDWAPAIAAAWR